MRRRPKLDIMNTRNDQEAREIVQNNRIIIIIIIIIMFFVLSSRQNHCKSSPGSLDDTYRPHV